MTNYGQIDPLYEGQVKITPADKSLQKKAGVGEIDPELILKAEQFIQDNDEDFTPMALELLAKLASTLARIKRHNIRTAEVLQELEAPVMQLKANGKMFKYDLVTSLASITLDFLESIDTLDDDVLALVTVQLSGLQVIIAQKMKGSGGLDGMRLREELEEACQRYYKKNPLALKGR
jgi:hypothetical protein